MTGLALYTVLLAAVCGAVFFGAGPGSSPGRSPAIRLGMAVLSVGTLCWWFLVLIIRPAWSGAWETAAWVHGAAVLLNCAVVLRLRADWPGAALLTARAAALFLAVLVLGLALASASRLASPGA